MPLLAAEIAAEAKRCRDAGAAVIHLHAREPDGTATQSKVRFAEFIAAIAAETDVIIQTSTGGAIGMSIDERCQPLELRPEMATLNVATMNFGDEVFENRRGDVAEVARRLLAAKIVPELEVYDAGHLDAVQALRKAGLLEPPYHVQFVLGVPGGIGATPEGLAFLVERLHAGLGDECTWAVAAVGRHQLPMTELAIRWGGFARVGLEDNIYLAKGVLAEGSAPLVERAAAFARAFGRPVATPAQARAILGLG